ncbi:MAG: copper homeostasis periplasmic binding protein CopC [Pseudomonadota bacterium]|uniref:copper homeostasis periplasmic binding protein CopC n=1 Tax=Sphingomonas sp. ERG5 TaxID=1381597 RepID=UPI00054BB9C5|nr:copper homeostasis periplasmic binding protein CopC [Sphingomonas sp. ERG5]
MNFVRPLVASFILAGLAIAAPAVAHPKLLSSQPVANASVAKPSKITLVFSETLVAQMSGMTVVMTGMPGMANHAPMKMSGFKTSVAKDGKTLVAAFARPLPAGTYQIQWHVVSTDTHRVDGSVAFTVK